MKDEIESVLAQFEAGEGSTRFSALRADQFHRWREGKRPSVELYVERVPELQETEEALLDLIYGEVMLREEAGEEPTVDEYVQRFPSKEVRLRRLFEVHAALKQGSLLECAGFSSAPENVLQETGPYLSDPIEEKRDFQQLSTRPPGEEDTDPNRTRPVPYEPVVDPEKASTRTYNPQPAADKKAHGKDKAAPPAPWDVKLPGYEVLSILGRGGMGVVYKARHIKLNRVVAIKMVLSGQHISRDEWARFHGEAEVIARLQHPNIVQVYEIGEHEGKPYFSLEFVEGGSLDRKIAGTPWNPRKAAELVEVIARAMHAAHEKGVVHRDLKPANVLIATDSTPKITDFGLAKKLDDDSGATRTGQVMGTPAYMAPEQAQGKIKEIGPISDVYALAAIFYELLVGKPPFRGATVFDTLDQVCNQEPVPPSRLQPKTPRDLETICLKGLFKEPARRYASGKEMADDLRRYLDGEPILARPVGIVEKTIKLVKRKKKESALVASLVLAVLVGVGGYVAYRFQNEAIETQQAKSDLETEKQRVKRYEQFNNLNRLKEKAKSPEDWKQVQALAEAALKLLGDDEAQESLRTEAVKIKNLAENRVSGLGKYQEFLRLVASAFHHFALSFEQEWSDGKEQVRFTREAAKAALEICHVMLDNDESPVLDDMYLEGNQPEEVRQACSELLLLWSRAEAPLPGDAESDRVEKWNKSLRLTDRARKLGKTAQALHFYRLQYFQGLKDDKNVAEEIAQAKEVKANTAADHFLLGYWAITLRKGDMEESVLKELGLDQGKKIAWSDEHFKETLKLNEDHYWANYYLAAQLSQRKPPRFDRAAQLLTVCIKQPQWNSPWPFVLRGYASGMLGDSQESMADFASAEKLAGDDKQLRYIIFVDRAVVHNSQAQALLGNAAKASASGEAELARKFRQQALRLLDQAVADLREAAKLRKDQQVPLALASIYEDQARYGDQTERDGKLEEALTEFNRAIESFPSEGAFRSRAKLYLQRENYQEALKDYDQAIALHPDNIQDRQHAVDLVEKGRIHFRLKDYASAQKAYQLGQEVYPGGREYPMSHRLRGETLLELNKPKSALEALERFLKHSTEEPPASVYRITGLIHAKMEKYAAAVADYTHALEISRRQKLRGKERLHTEDDSDDGNDKSKWKDPDAQTLGYRGWAYLILNTPKMALEDFKRAVDLDPNNSDALLGRGCAQVQLGDWKSAVRDTEEALRQGLKQNQASSRLFYNAARVYSQSAGRIDEDPVASRDATLKQQRLEFEKEALRLLSEAMKLEQIDERAKFWDEYIRNDPGLRQIRRTPEFARLNEQYAGRAGK